MVCLGKFALFALTVFFSISALGQERNSSVTDWKCFSPPDGSFSVLMPGRPSETLQPVEEKTGPNMMHMFSFEASTIEYLVSYIDFQVVVEETQLAKKVFDSARDGAIAKESGKLLREIDVSIGTHSGREIVIQAADGTFRDRLYLVGKRFYMLSVFIPFAKDPGELKKAQELNEQKFFDSFRLRSNASAEKPN